MDLNIHSPLPQKKDWRIGIIGSGFIVSDCHLVAYRKAGFNPVAIASRTRANAEKVAQRHGIPKVYDTVEQLLADPSIEVLDIAVPPNAQFATIKAACARKTVKGILAQKPLGMDYREALAAVELCEAAGITLAVNQNMRYDQSVRAAKTLLTNGTIGDPVFATIDMRGIPHWMPWQKDLGWVTLRIMSIHHLDCFRYWFGDPERIYCSVRKDPRTEFPHEDGIATYILEYRNGLRCVGIDDTWTGPAKEGCPGDIRINWRIEGLNGLAMGDIGWCKDPYTSPSTIRYASKGMHGFQSPVWSESWFPDAFIGPMAQLLIALEQGARPAIDGRDNLLTMALVDAAYKSVKDKAAVEVQEIYGEVIREKLERDLVEKPSGLFSQFLKPIIHSVPESVEEAVASFTPRTQQIFNLAKKEAERLGHQHLEDLHLLLGLFALGQGVGVVVLKEFGVDFAGVKSKALLELAKLPVMKNSDDKRFYGLSAKEVMAIATREKKKLHHTYLGTEHILLGILQAKGSAAEVLRFANLDVEEVRQAVMRELDPNCQTDETPTDLAPSETVTMPQGTFTPRVKVALLAAQKESNRLNIPTIGTLQIMAGLLTTDGGVAEMVLTEAGVGLERVREEIKRVYGSSAIQNDTDLPFSIAAAKVIASAHEESKKWGHAFTATEHMLLGLLQSDTENLIKFFRTVGVDREVLRQKILKELR